MRMNKKINLITSLIFQVATMLSGLILPRIIIGTFGSELNGMVSSITQFLSFISLLEGGLGAVVLAELYKPINDKDDNQIKSILCSSQKFFSKLAFIFVIYTVVLSIVYSYIFQTDYSFGFVCSLVYILSFTTLVQYLFAITFKLLLQAQQKIYIVNIVSTATVLINLILSVILIHIFPSIHLIKLCSAFAFLLQPIVFKFFVEKKFRNLKSNESKNNYIISNRWDGFAQNLAHFVNLNTDIVVITLFLSLADVSVYTVYLLPITALRSIISSMTNSYQSALGKYYAQGEKDLLKTNFEKFNRFNLSITIAMFGTCLILIVPFVSLYTQNIHDANYYQPIFAILITVANMFFCIREPFRFLVLAAGKFKETNFGAVMEVIINLALSLILITRYSLIGVAIGTLIAVVYRFVYLIVYLKKNVLQKRFRSYLGDAIKTSALLCINIVIAVLMDLRECTFIQFCILGFVIFVFESAISFFLYFKLNIKKVV